LVKDFEASNNSALTDRAQDRPAAMAHVSSPLRKSR
jgi:hypothetical protein